MTADGKTLAQIQKEANLEYHRLIINEQEKAKFQNLADDENMRTEEDATSSGLVNKLVYNINTNVRVLI